MSARGAIRHGNTTLEWDEQKGELRLIPETQGDYHTLFMTYDQARAILDCLMVVFGRQEITVRYPEVR